MYSYVLISTRMFPYVTRMYSYVIRMYSYVTRIYSSVSVCYSYVLVCCLSHDREVAFFSGNSGKCCSIRHWTFLEMHTLIFGRMESALGMKQVTVCQIFHFSVLQGVTPCYGALHGVTPCYEEL